MDRLALRIGPSQPDTSSMGLVGGSTAELRFGDTEERFRVFSGSSSSLSPSSRPDLPRRRWVDCWNLSTAMEEAREANGTSVQADVEEEPMLGPGPAPKVRPKRPLQFEQAYLDSLPSANM